MQDDEMNRVCVTDGKWGNACRDVGGKSEEDLVTDGSILLDFATKQQSVDRIDLAQMRGGWWLL
jgi:hypothetical protein